MSPAVRARIGTARMRPGGTSTSRNVAAIAIDTFIGSGLPQTSATAFVSATAASTDRPATRALARERDHSLGARIDRLVQRMAVAGDRLASLAVLARDSERRLVDRADQLGARQNVVDELAAEIGRAQDHRAAAEHAGGDCALKRGGIGGVGHARRLDRRRQPMLGDRDEAQIEKEALLLGRRAAGREEVEEFGESGPAHQIAGEVASAHADPIGRSGGDRSLRGSGLADQHARLLLRARPYRFSRQAQLLWQYDCRTISEKPRLSNAAGCERRAPDGPRDR